MAIEDLTPQDRAFNPYSTPLQEVTVAPAPGVRFEDPSIHAPAVEPPAGVNPNAWVNPDGVYASGPTTPLQQVVQVPVQRKIPTYEDAVLAELDKLLVPKAEDTSMQPFWKGLMDWGAAVQAKAAQPGATTFQSLGAGIEGVRQGQMKRKALEQATRKNKLDELKTTADLFKTRQEILESKAKALGTAKVGKPLTESEIRLYGQDPLKVSAHWGKNGPIYRDKDVDARPMTPEELSSFGKGEGYNGYFDTSGNPHFSEVKEDFITLTEDNWREHVTPQAWNAYKAEMGDWGGFVEYNPNTGKVDIHKGEKPADVKNIYNPETREWKQIRESDQGYQNMLDQGWAVRESYKPGAIKVYTDPSGMLPPTSAMPDTPLGLKLEKMGYIPQSLTTSGSEITANKGLGLVQSVQELDFAQNLIDKAFVDIAKEGAVYGAVGDIRAWAQSAAGAATDAAKFIGRETMLGRLTQDAQEYLVDPRAIGRAGKDNWTEELSRAQLIKSALTYTWAKIQKGGTDSRLNKQDIQKAEDSLGFKGLTAEKDIISRLGLVTELVADKRRDAYSMIPSAMREGISSKYKVKRGDSSTVPNGGPPVFKPTVGPDGKVTYTKVEQ